MKIGKYQINVNEQPFIIAEMSGNHNQSLERALEIVEAASVTGAHAIKLQTYTSATMTLNLEEEDFFISDPNSLWVGQSMHNLYEKAHTPWEWHAPIMQRAQELGMICFSSPFDESAIDFLESLNVPAYKIASFECIDLPLIRKAASTGKPLIISTGMASILEIAEAVDAARSNGCQQLALLKCTSTYPASPENSNLKTIAHLRDLFGCEVGLSDHTMGIGAAIISVAFGATIIEKHFTLARADGGVDSTFSMEPEELADLVVESHRAWQALGNIQYGPTESEKKAVLRRRSIYISKDIKAGDLLTLDNLRRVRPGYGLAPKYYEMALGRRVKKDLKAGTPLSWEILD